MSLPSIPTEWLGGRFSKSAASNGATDRTDRADGAVRKLSRPQPLSLRWRLTLTFTAVLATMLVVFSLVVYWFFGHQYMAEIARSSQQRAAQVQEIVFRRLEGVPLQQRVLRRYDFMGKAVVESGILEESFDPFRHPGIGVRLFDYRGQPVFASNNEITSGGRLLFNRVVMLAASNGREHVERLNTADESYYVYSRPVFHEGRLAAVIQILTTLEPYDSTMAQLANLLALGTLFAVGMSLLTGAALAQTAIAPIGAISRTAERINREQDLGRRIQLRGSSDEIGRLGVTINEMLDRIECMFERQRRLLADVSHELRTPLTTIRGEVELMERTGQMDPEALIAVREESKRMSRMIDDLLLLARAEAGAVPDMLREPIELHELLLDVFQQAQMLARDSHPVVLTHDDTAVIIGERDRLKQLILNLVSNALKHTPKGTTIELALHRDETKARIVVADNGPGIPAEHLSHLFDRFYRVDKARSRQSGSGGGAGLGLSIVHQIAAAHSGEVVIESDEGEGTRVTLTVPLAETT